MDFYICFHMCYHKNGCNRDFPGGSVIKNLPANRGDTSSAPGRWRSHMLQGNQVSVPQLLKPTRLEPVLLKGGHQGERPEQGNKE